MSIFPTKIFLATDGSEEAELALRAATDPAKHAHCPVLVTRYMPKGSRVEG
jgi:hypothetical protein